MLCWLVCTDVSDAACACCCWWGTLSGLTHTCDPAISILRLVRCCDSSAGCVDPATPSPPPMAIKTCLTASLLGKAVGWLRAAPDAGAPALKPAGARA
jgi:hypothetical protein